jgi:hypothetical protein
MRLALFPHAACLDMLIPGFGFEDAWVPKPEGRFLWFGALNSVPGAIETLLAGREREYITFVLQSMSANPRAFADEDIDDYAEGYSGEGGLEPLGRYFRAMWTNADHFRSEVSSGKRINAPCWHLAVSIARTREPRSRSEQSRPTSRPGSFRMLATGCRRSNQPTSETG